MTIASAVDLETLNPLLWERATAHQLDGLIYESLLTVAPTDGALIPNLARSWNVSTDSLTVTFKLRDDVRWHDGAKLSAYDMEYTLKTALGQKVNITYRERLDVLLHAHYIKDFAAVDEMTFVVNLTEPFCPILYDIGLLPVLPQHAAHTAAPPLGTGPFMVKSWSAGAPLVLAQNPDHWRAAPILDAIVLRPLADEDDVLNQLTNDEIDVALLSTPRAAISATAALTAHVYPQMQYTYIGYNLEHPALADTATRWALAYALDRAAIISQTAPGALPLDYPLLPTHWAYAAAPDDYPITYAPARARALLAEAGWEDSDADGILEHTGVPLTLTIIANVENETRANIAILTQQYYQRVGVEAHLQLLEWWTFLERMLEHDFDVLVYGWDMPLDPDSRDLFHSAETPVKDGFNAISYTNVLVDTALDAGRQTLECRPATRRAHYAQTQKEMMTELPIYTLFAPAYRVIGSERLPQLAPSPYAGPFWNAAVWQLYNR